MSHKLSPSSFLSGCSSKGSLVCVCLSCDSMRTQLLQLHTPPTTKRNSPAKLHILNCAIVYHSLIPSFTRWPGRLCVKARISLTANSGYMIPDSSSLVGCHFTSWLQSHSSWVYKIRAARFISIMARPMRIKLTHDSYSILLRIIVMHLFIFF